MNTPICISIFEDNDSLRKSLSHLFTYEQEFVLCGSFSNCNTIEEHLAEYMPEMILMDIDMQGTSGIEGLKKALIFTPEIIVVMFTVFEDEDKIFDALCAGARGYILKKISNEKLLEALKDIYNGGSYITPLVARKVLHKFSKPQQEVKKEYNLSTRENEVLKLLSEGYSYKMIAAKCQVTLDTIRHHIKNIYQKLQVNSNVEAVKKALQKKIV